MNDWLHQNLQILATLGSALALYIFIRSAARREVTEIRAEQKEIRAELKEIRLELKSIDQRLTRLEGRFEERGYWESREWHKTGTEDKK